MLKTVIAIIALALTALPVAAGTATECARAESFAVTENAAPLTPDGVQTLPFFPEGDDAAPLPGEKDGEHREHRPRGEGHRGHHRHGHGGEHRCPHRHGEERGNFPTPETDLCGVADLFLTRLTPEVIAVYEKCIAGKEIVSGRTEAELSLAADRLGVTEQKLKALILLADLMARTSKPVPLSALASLGDGELLRLARRHAKMYAESIPEEERDALKAEFRAALKK